MLKNDHCASLGGLPSPYRVSAQMAKGTCLGKPHRTWTCCRTPGWGLKPDLTLPSLTIFRGCPAIFVLWNFQRNTPFGFYWVESVAVQSVVGNASLSKISAHLVLKRWGHLLYMLAYWLTVTFVIEISKLSFARMHISNAQLTHTLTLLTLSWLKLIEITWSGSKLDVFGPMRASFSAVFYIHLKKWRICPNFSAPPLTNPIWSNG